MAALLYIHGFLSSPLSAKAQQVQAWLAAEHPEIDYHCPQLSPYPLETLQTLERLVESILPQPVYLIGSSLGGFWATWLAEKYNLRALLVNPAVKPHEFMPKYVGHNLKSYHAEDVYQLHDNHVDEIEMFDVQLKRLENYWLLVQTGDETLDFTQAVRKYAGGKQTIEEGGDHSFHGFDRYLASGLEFFTNQTIAPPFSCNSDKNV